MSEALLPKTRLLVARSTFSKELSRFSNWLETEHYSSPVIHLHLLRLNYVLPRLPKAAAGGRCSLSCLRAAFGRERRPLTRFHHFRATRRAYERFLNAGGRLVGVEVDERFGALQEAYRRQLSELRGLSLSSRSHHAHTVADFLARGLNRSRSLAKLQRADVERYVALRSREVSRHSLQHVVAYLRAFLRYCHDRGHIQAALHQLDTPRAYRGELPPQALPWASVRRLLAGIDRRSKAGWRDYCLLHLMAHYGLRPSEVVALQLDSIDWEAGSLRVRQCKTGSQLLLPLQPRTLAILRRYLQTERLAQGTLHEALFLRLRCPSGPLQRTAVANVFAKRAWEAGLELRGKHVYCLRHAFAMRLLSRGVGIKLIGDVLGHRNLESTCAYLRLDLSMLRGVALPVPSAPRKEIEHA